MYHFIIFDMDGPHRQGHNIVEADVAARFLSEAAAFAKASGQMVNPVVVQYEPQEGDAHARAVTQTVHRVHVNAKRAEDGAVSIIDLHHYPDREPADIPQRAADMATSNMFLTKRQFVKIPAAFTKRHWVVSQPKSIQMKVKV